MTICNIDNDDNNDNRLISSAPVPAAEVLDRRRLAEPLKRSSDVRKQTAARLQRVCDYDLQARRVLRRKGLTAQTGHALDEWPLVIAKELIDNALDACEEV